ncbi:MAG: thioredoxin [Spirochaetaceae bacterium]|jgi:thioredoxin 1|nr:thioredoxin [Spirochaetaceae bacterium]
MSSDVLKITAENFEAEVVKSQIPVLIEFSAPWCASCRSLNSLIDEIRPAYEGEIKFASVDVDDEEELREKHGVLSVPTIELYKNGDMLDKKTGELPRKQLTDFIEKALF